MGYEVRWMMLILLVVAPLVLILGLAVLVAVFRVWIGIVRERRAVERCLCLHAANVKKNVDDLS